MTNFIRSFFFKQEDQIKVLAPVDFSDAALAEINARNLARAEEVKKSLGEKFLLHPRHRVTKEAYQASIAS